MMLSWRFASKVKPVALMRLTEIDDPDELLKEYGRDGIVVEEKLDGWKAQAIKSKGEVRLYSRRGQDVTDNFPELVEALKGLPDGTLVEGELVYWEGKKQDVGKMTSLANSAPEKSREKAAELPGEVRFHAYDILWKGGTGIAEHRFDKRRKALESVLKPSKKILLTKQYPFSDWQKAMSSAVESGGEGIVLKRKDAHYHYASAGEREPKPAGVMWKYKGGGGKSESDDYVVYDHTTGDKGKLKALFGQYYKGKLYHISEISNFSAKDEKEIKERLGKGPFVMEIGFQERVPKGLRHQKFVRFRDDKKPKDATMNEFHVEHIDELSPAKQEADDISAFAAVIPRGQELIREVEQTLGIRRRRIPVGKRGRYLKTTDFSGLKNVPGIDIKLAYHVISKLESNRRFVVADSGTSFGTLGVQFGTFLQGLARDSQANVSGMTPSELRRLAAVWNTTVRSFRKEKMSMWKAAPIDEAAVRATMKKRGRVIRRMEGTTVRHSPGGVPGIVRIRKDGSMAGYIINPDLLRKYGVDPTAPEIQAKLRMIAGKFITGGVVRNGLVRIVVEHRAKDLYRRFTRTFTSRNVNHNRPLRDLADRVAMRNFTWRVDAVMRAIKKYGYDVTNPDAFNQYQLVAIANGSGYGRVLQFLKYRKLFHRGNLQYLRKANPAFSKAGIPSKFPPRGGIGGFPDVKVASLLAAELFVKADDEPIGGRTLPGIPAVHDSAAGTAGAVRHMIERYLSLEEIDRDEWETSPVGMISLLREPPLLKVLLKSDVDLAAMKRLLPDNIQGVPLELSSLPARGGQRQQPPPREPGVLSPREREEFRHRPTQVMPEGRLPSQIFMEYDRLLRKVREELAAMGKHVPEGDIKRTVLLYVANQHGISHGDLLRMFGDEVEWLRMSCRRFPLSKRGGYMEPGTMAFPGQFAEDIKSGKKEVTIRPGDLPVRPEEVVTAITYSNAPICRIKILSKEIMSLKRIEKAFGKRCARSLERRFGANRRFVVIRFERFDANEADDGDNDKKMAEVLIDGEKTMTRGQIKAHYSKPSVRKSIMERIKGKPVLIYIGTGKGQKILKRNHNGKPIVIESDDKGSSESPNNYWYWVKRRVLSFHEVFGTKTDLGFVDLDLHGGYPLAKAKEYARKLSGALRKEFGTSPVTYDSGGTGLHVEFKLKEQMSIDKLRKQLKELLNELNEDFERATTGLVKGKGMRTDISTLHSKGSLRVPGSLGESQGKVKRKISGAQDIDDNYGNTGYGKHNSEGPEDSGREGAFAVRPPTTVTSQDGSAGWAASDDKPQWWLSEGDAVGAFSSRKDLFRKARETHGASAK